MHNTAALPILLKELRLFTILESWQSLLQKAETEGWNYARFLSVLFEHEVETRHRKRIQTYLRKAHLPPGKSLATFDFSQVQTLNKAKVDDLGVCRIITWNYHVINTTLKNSSKTYCFKESL